MSDPRYTDPRYDTTNPPPPRGPYQREPNSSMAWIIGGVAALAVIFAVAWSMSDRSRIASSPASETTGQNTRAPAPAPLAPLTAPRNP